MTSQECGPRRCLTAAAESTPLTTCFALLIYNILPAYRTYLAHHELESDFIIIIAIIVYQLLELSGIHPVPGSMPGPDN